MSTYIRHPTTSTPAVVLKRLVRALRRLEKDWPKDYWLFAASGTLNLMHAPGGQRAMTADQGMDPKAIVETFKGIKCDGGDW